MKIRLFSFVRQFSRRLPIVAVSARSLHISPRIKILDDDRLSTIGRKMKTISTIGTHDGTFHCDEVFGCVMLKVLHPSARIVRSRRPEVLDACDIVIDVGGTYDPQALRFDHHQKGFEETAASLLGKKWTVKLSSAGLVYCTFGKEIIRRLARIEKDDDVDKIFDKIYENIILEVDGIDNGIMSCCETPKYWVHTGLSSRVSHLNKGWNQKEFDETLAFENAMKLVESEFVERVRYFVDDWLPARDIVRKAIDNRRRIDDSGELIELETFCPWKAHYFDLEQELKLEPTVKYVIFNDGPSWRVQAVPLDEKSFILRVPLLEKWRGLREKDIDCEGAIFVHGTGFIGGNSTREGALAMARITLAARQS